MKISNPLKLRTQENHTPRNAFDMSYSTVFSSPGGMLLPCYVEDVQPGDFVKMNVQNFTRTTPVQTAAYTQIREQVDFYFVPYRLLWRWFDDFITGVNTIDTANYPNLNLASGVAVTQPKMNVPTVLYGDLLAGIASMTSTNNGDMFFSSGFSIRSYALRLLDMLGYGAPQTPMNNETNIGNWLNSFSGSSSYNTVPVNIFRILAFQRIYRDYYRNTDYEQNDPLSFNIDQFTTNITDTNAGGRANLNTYIRKWFTPRYKSWNKDVFTSLVPSVSGSAVDAGFQLASTGASFNPFLNIDSKAFFTGNGNYTYAIGKDDTYSSMNQPRISASQIRNVLALDKLSRITALAPKTYASQIKAHFGVDVRDHENVTYLGSHNSSVQVGEILQTSETTQNSPLGTVAGKGIGSSQDGHFKYDVKEHGIIMGIHYIVPNAQYTSNRFNRFNQKSYRADYFVPEFDNLGLQPVYNSQRKLETGINPNEAFGWQSRYMEYKSRVDEVHFDFQGTRQNNMWTAPRSLSIGSNFSITELKVNPSVFNPIFVLAYNGFTNRDNFLCNYQFNVIKVSNMSVNGIPTL